MTPAAQRPSRARARAGRRCRRAAGAGFTLIELTVALLAALIVAMGIVSLSREATRTFHDEVRSSAAEATLRTAVDRLRADLQRAGYMSTGNISGDPKIAVPPGQTNWSNIPGTMLGLRRLASVRLIEGGSVATSGLPLSAVQTPVLAPDAIELAGNIASAEQFEVELIQPPGGNCQRILLSPYSAAIYRIAPTGDTQGAQELRNAFQPVPAGMSTQFMVRLVDDTGHAQFLATCAEPNAAGFAGTQPYVDVDSADTPILTAQATKTNGGVSGYASGRALVNPVQIVRWEITGSTQEAASQVQYANGLDNLSTAYGTIDPNKYDLVRTYVDVFDRPVPQSMELVAEYAVDLDFAFTIDAGTSSAAPLAQTFPFEDDGDNDAWAKAVDTQTAAPWTPGPQRIRAVRARVVTRTQLGDRTANVPVTQFGTEQFIYRYCINATPACNTNDGTMRWARARTVTTEVSLPNDQGNFF